MSSPARLKIGFLLAIALLSVNLFVPLLTAQRSSELLSRYETEERIHSQLQELLSALKDGETGQRGFVITGREDYLSPLYQGYADVDRLLIELGSGLAGRIESMATLERLKQLVTQQREYFAMVIALRREKGIEEAAGVIATGRGKQLMDDVRHQGGQLLEHVKVAMLLRDRDIRDFSELRLLLIVLISVLDLLMVAVLFYLTFRALHEGRQVQRDLQGLSDQLAGGLQRVELRNHEISLLNRLGRAMHLSSQFGECYEIVQCFAAQLFPHSRGCLSLYHPSRDVLEAVVSWGGWADTQAMFEPQACWAIRRGQSHVVRETGKDLLCPHLGDNSESYLCIPLMAQGEPLGVLTLVGTPLADHDLAETFAEQVALGISNLSLRESLRQQSLVDTLTGLHNRRFLDETLRRELLRASRKQASVAVVLLDVDHFKRFNDTFGHEAGDLVLRHLAMEMKRNVRTSDLACRYGGEEFALVLPEIGREEAVERCETLRLAVSRLQVRYGGQPLGPINISLGLAWFPQDGERMDVLLHAADLALYQAKRGGRNRLCIYDRDMDGSVAPEA
jgi:diguanylate cyclase (GGDEF)-like protein